MYAFVSHRAEGKAGEASRLPGCQSTICSRRHVRLIYPPSVSFASHLHKSCVLCHGLMQLEHGSYMETASQSTATYQHRWLMKYRVSSLDVTAVRVARCLREAWTISAAGVGSDRQGAGTLQVSFLRYERLQDCPASSSTIFNAGSRV